MGWSGWPATSLGPCFRRASGAGPAMPAVTVVVGKVVAQYTSSRFASAPCSCARACAVRGSLRRARSCSCVSVSGPDLCSGAAGGAGCCACAEVRAGAQRRNAVTAARKAPPSRYSFV